MTDDQPFIWACVNHPRPLGDFVIWLQAAGISLEGELQATVAVGDETVDFCGGQSHSFDGLGTLTLVRVEIHPSLGYGGGNRAKFEVDLTPLYESEAAQQPW